MSKIIETKTRSVLKTVLWRIIATVNAYIVISTSIVDGNWSQAILMNFTGMVIMYFYERIWSGIDYGRTIEEDESSI